MRRDRQDDAQPQPRQLLRRDRAGRLPPRPRRARASTSPTTRCCRAGCSPTSTRSSSASAARTSTRSRSTARSRPCTTTSATATCGRRSITGRVGLRAELARRRLPVAGRRRRRRLRAATPSGSTRRRSARAATASSTTSARRRCSATASRAPEQEHIVKALRFELGKVEIQADPRAHGRPAVAGRRQAGAARVAAGLGHSTSRRTRDLPLNGSSPPTPIRRGTSRSRGPRWPSAPSPALSMANTVKGTIVTRKIAILAADGIRRRPGGDAEGADEGRRAGKIVAPRLGRLKGAAAARRSRRLQPPHLGLRAVRRRLRARRGSERGGFFGRARCAALRDGGVPPLQGDRGDRRGARCPSIRSGSRRGSAEPAAEGRVRLRVW